MTGTIPTLLVLIVGLPLLATLVTAIFGRGLLREKSHLPVVVALLLAEVPRGKILFRTIFFLPQVSTGLVILFLWKLFYDPTAAGFLNRVLWFADPIDWLNDPAWANHVRHHEEIAKHGEAVGACLAIETGPEPPYVLKRLIETVGSDAIRINWDPANLILWPARYAQDAGEEYDRDKWIELYQPVEGLNVVGEYVVHVHAKDALVHEDGRRQEVAFGTGWVDWDRFITLLCDDYSYDGYFAIEREVGDNPVADIQAAVDFLKGFQV